MQIVIDIDEELKHSINAKGLFLNPHEKISLIDAINNGTVLPQGHGRLIDESEIQYNEIWMTHENGGRTCIGWEADIDNAPTVLEADMRGVE